MKKLISFILVFAMLVPAVAFADYNVSDWAEAEVAKAEEVAIIPAEFENLDLTQNITRAEFTAVAVTLFRQLYNRNLYSYGGEFTDIEGSPYEQYIRSAYYYGITKGTEINEDGSVVFSPDEYITREQLATMLCRVLMKIVLDHTEFPEEYVADVPFEDDAQISDYAKVAVYCMSEIGIIKGVSETHFAPLDTATREQAIILSQRIYEDSIDDVPEKNVAKTEKAESYIGKTFDELVAEFGEPEFAFNYDGWHYMFYLFGDYAFAFDGVRLFAPADGTPVYPDDELYEEPTVTVKGVFTTINTWLSDDRAQFSFEDIYGISGIDFYNAPTEHWTGNYYHMAYDSENVIQYMIKEFDGTFVSGDKGVLIQDYSHNVYNPNENEEE
ncbi:MAG: S-layer homology domain-containing protein [Clostridia bacterium]|nr:S-layer homology domain-containing protein [Clostridia bacterium]